MIMCRVQKSSSRSHNLMLLSTTSVCSRVLKNGIHLSILSHVLAVFVISLNIFEEIYISESTFHAELNSLRLFVPYPFIKVSILYGCIIKYQLPLECTQS